MKLKAKDQLLGNYGIAAGSFALLFVIVYAIVMIIMTAFTAGVPDSAVVALSRTSLPWRIGMQAMGMVIGAMTLIFTVGYYRLISKIADGEHPQISEIFFVFRNHPDKIIILSFIMTGAQFLLTLPAALVGNGGFGEENPAAIDGKKFLLWIVLYLTGFIISYIIELMLAMSYMIYLDDPDEGLGSVITQSVNMMKGNKFRYFYLTLSFIGYWLLILLSLGIAALWVVPYQSMTVVGFYRDLRGDVEYAEAEYV